ncbi:unnamed protein product [Parajaminaea phylloscopi]
MTSILLQPAALIAVAGLLLACLSTAHARHWSFELNHHPLVAQRLDLIVFPGKIAGHTHLFAGSPALLPEQQHKRESMCTTADVKADKSLYWAPALYHFDADTETFTSLPLLNFRTVYADGRPDASTPLKEYPQGMMIIGGNSTRYELWDDPIRDRAKSFTCHDYSTGPPLTTSLFPKGPCRDGIVTRIVMPSCWDGKHLDAPNHHDHMAYPEGGNPISGTCPKTHPVRFLAMTFELTYDSKEFKASPDGKSGFVLSTADMVGTTMHADFVMGWAKGVLQDAIDHCPDLTGLPHALDLCPAFKASLATEARYDTLGSMTKMIERDGSHVNFCATKQSVMESVLGSMKYLPGCRPIMNGPSKDKGEHCDMKAVYPISAEGGGPNDGQFVPTAAVRTSPLRHRRGLGGPLTRRGLVESSVDGPAP